MTLTLAPPDTRAPIVLRPSARIRPLAERDLPEVTRLHRRVFPNTAAVDDAAYHAYFTDVFLANPAGPGPHPSLVCEEAGRLTGFVGLVPRSVVLDGERFRAVVSSQFIIDPACRVGLVALRLAKAYLEGPQDLSIADEANEISRKMWEGLGGTTATVASLYWTRPLRPGRLAVNWMRQRRALRPVAAVGAPLAAAVDALACRLPGSPLYQPEPSSVQSALRHQTLPACPPGFSGDGLLRVEYDGRTLEWLLDRAGGGAGGRAHQVLGNGGRVLGWYVWRLDADGAADVGLLAASPASIDDVLDHLFHQARRGGAVAVTGRFDPRFAQALSDRHCLLHRRGPWVLIKAARPELRRAFAAGGAGFSRLDGEWSLRFWPSAGAARESRRDL